MVAKNTMDAVKHLESLSDAEKVKGKITIDGQTFDCWAASADDIAGVQAYLDQTKRANAEKQVLTDATNAEIAQKDAEIAAINREIEATKARVKAQKDEIDRGVAKRLALLRTVEILEPGLKTKDLSDHAIRREIVRKRFGDEAVNDRTDEYVEARFDIMADAAKIDPFARVVADGLKTNDGRSASDRAYDEMVEHMSDAYKSIH